MALSPGSFMGFGPGLFLQGLNALTNFGQQQQAEQYNRDILGGAMGGLSYMGGNPNVGNTFNLPGGGSFTLPYDPTQGIKDIGTDIGGRISADTAAAQQRYKDYASSMGGVMGGHIGQMRNLYDQGAEALNRGYAGREQGVLDAYQKRFGGYQGEVDRETGELQNWAGRRYLRGMENLRGMGVQERKDLDTRYNAQAGRIGQDLTSRGLGNTTVRGSMLQGNERERSDAIGRLNESLRAERLRTDAALSGDLLAQQNLGAQARLGARGEFVNNYTNMQSGLSGERLGQQGALFGNQVNLYGQTGTQGLNLQNQLGAGGLDIANTGAQNLTNLYANLAQQRFGTGQQANAAMIDTLRGVNAPYPDPINAISQLGGQGAGANAQANIANEYMRKAYESSWLNMIPFHGQMGYSSASGPYSNFTGGF